MIRDVHPGSGFFPHLRSRSKGTGSGSATLIGRILLFSMSYEVPVLEMVLGIFIVNFILPSRKHRGIWALHSYFSQVYVCEKYVKYDVNLFVALFPLPCERRGFVSTCLLYIALYIWTGVGRVELVRSNDETRYIAAHIGLGPQVFLLCAIMRACIPSFPIPYSFMSGIRIRISKTIWKVGSGYTVIKIIAVNSMVRNCNYFLRFRFRLLKSYSSGSCSEF